MDAKTLIEKKSIQALFHLLIQKDTVRKKVISIIEAKMFNMMVENDQEYRPRRVQEDKVDYIMALLYGFDRIISKGIISNHVMDRWVRIFIGNVLLNKDQDIAAKSLGFHPPVFMLISPTGKCNLRCIGCYAASDPSNHASLDFATFDRILTEKREFWGSHFTVISGGEPFMWRDGDYGLLDMVAQHPSDYFMVYTNSTLITDDVAKRMAELGNITPAISVEGFEKETDARRGKGVHRRILAAFENLRNHGVPFGISATPTRDNWEIITSNEFVDFYYEQEGALYGWLFQYMPIGRGQSLDLMVSPEQRVAMLGRMLKLIRERKVFMADFWNSGPASSGCICAGRTGGYFYIDWNGDVMPCAFVPYSNDNIYNVYANGGTINTLLDSPLFRKIRDWQNRYGFTKHAEQTSNWLCPCVIRDHVEVLKEAVIQSGAKPINDEASIALQDDDYYEGLLGYGKEILRLTDPIWEEQYVPGAVRHAVSADKKQ